MKQSPPKVKKRIIAILSLLIVTSLLLAGCSSSSAGTEPAVDNFNAAPYAASTPAAYDTGEEESFYSKAAEQEVTAGAEGDSAQGGDIALTQPQDNRKVILNASMTMETLGFDDTCSALRRLVDETGGYISAANVEAADSSYGTLGRTAYFTAQIPSDKYSGFLAGAEGSGNILNRNESSRDVTAEYVDIEARLAALRTQEQRLTELVAAAANLEELLELQDRLTELQYEIEAYTAQKRTFDQLTAYSTVDITVYEVREITEPEPEEVTFWTRVDTAWREMGQGTTVFFQGLFLALIHGLPFIIFLVIAGIIALILLRRYRRKMKENPPKPKPSPAYPYYTMAAATPIQPAPTAQPASPAAPAPTPQSANKTGSAQEEKPEPMDDLNKKNQKAGAPAPTEEKKGKEKTK